MGADVHTREEHWQLGRDQLFDRQEDGFGRRLRHHDEARDVVRHLDPGEALGTRSGLADQDAEVERQTRDVGKRVSGVNGQRGEHREDLAAEVSRQRGPVLIRQRIPSDDPDALLSQSGFDVLAEAAGVPGGQLMTALRDLGQRLARGVPVAGRHAQAHLGPPHQAGYPHHVELVQIAGEDGEELQALQQGLATVLGQGEHPGVEVEPGHLTVAESVLGQIRFCRRRRVHEIAVRYRVARIHRCGARGRVAGAVETLGAGIDLGHGAIMPASGERDVTYGPTGSESGRIAAAGSTRAEGLERGRTHPEFGDDLEILENVDVGPHGQRGRH